jgi:tetratricopeptide (TPR) repeat protein
MKHLTSLVIIILLVLSVLFSCAYYNVLFNAKRSYEEGTKELLKSTDRTQIPPRAKSYFEETIEKCWKLIELFSDKSKYADDALLYICKSEYHLQKYTQSKLHLDQFIKKYPKSKLIPEATLWYGKVLMRLEEYEEGDQELRNAINISNDSKIHAEAYFELGSFEFENANYEKAIEYYQQALNEKPDDQYQAMLQFNLGEAYYIQENYENAIKYFKKVEKYDPSVDIEYRTKLHMARSYSEIGKYEDAYKILRKMLTASRFNNFVPEIKTAIGENYEKQERYLDAIEIYRENISEKRASSGTAQAAFNLAGIYENVYKNVDSAVVYYGKVGKLYGRFDSLKVAQNKEIFLRELKDIRDAIRHDKRLVFKLENDSYFRDSLYAAQFEDSMKKVLGIAGTDSLEHDEQGATASQSLFDSLWAARQDSLDSLFSTHAAGVDQDTTENQSEFPPIDQSLFPGDSLVPGATEDDFPQTQHTGEGNQENGNKEKEMERRKLPQVKRDLMSTRYHLAEYYLLKVENYDSAAHYFKSFLAQYEDSVLTPKALYSLRFIYSQRDYKNPQLADSLEEVILTNYPESDFARVILKQRGLLAEEKEEEQLHTEAMQLFLRAESLYYAKRIDSALVTYDRVSELDTSAELGAKAMYAKAWIYEKEMNEKQLALETYEKIIQEYPEVPQYVSAAKKKTTMPKEAEKPPAGAEEGGVTAASQDTLQAEKGEESRGETISSGGEASHIIEADKIRWRMRKYGK